MAVGDVVSAITQLSAGASLTFQPASGVEVIITEIGSSEVVNASPNGVPDVTVNLYDGTNSMKIRDNKMAVAYQPLNLFLNNAIYLQLTNSAGTAKFIGYCGVVTNV